MLVVGDSCTDVYVYGAVDRLSPEAPIPVFVLKRELMFPGMAGNVAANMRGLDDDVTLCASEAAATKTRYVDERSRQQLIRVDDELETVAMTSAQLDEIEIEMADFDALVIVDYDKGFVDSRSISRLCSYAHSSSVPVYVDTKRTCSTSYTGCIVKLNSRERLYVKLGDECELVTTLGEGGAEWNGIVFPGKRVDVFDVAGAGDTFLSAFVHAHLCTGDVAASIAFANECAAIAISHQGTYALKQSDVDPLLDDIDGWEM